MHIDPNTLIIWLLVGAIAGWLAGQVIFDFFTPRGAYLEERA